LNVLSGLLQYKQQAAKVILCCPHAFLQGWSASCKRVVVSCKLHCFLQAGCSPASRMLSCKPLADLLSCAIAVAEDLQEMMVSARAHAAVHTMHLGASSEAVL